LLHFMVWDETMIGSQKNENLTHTEHQQ